VNHAAAKVRQVVRLSTADEMTINHDGRILADIIAEWAATHREPFTLVLDGPAGGTFVHGTGGEEVHSSVVDFVRTLAERTTASGVLRHTLPL